MATTSFVPEDDVTSYINPLPGVWGRRPQRGSGQSPVGLRASAPRYDRLATHKDFGAGSSLGGFCT